MKNDGTCSKCSDDDKMKNCIDCSFNPNNEIKDCLMCSEGKILVEQEEGPKLC